MGAAADAVIEGKTPRVEWMDGSVVVVAETVV